MDDTRLEGYALSPHQRRLWTLDSGDPASPCRAHALVSIEGPLDTSVFRAALGRAIARHELLRTRLWRDPAMTVPLQVIESGSASILSLHDACGLDDAARAARIDALL